MKILMFSLLLALGLNANEVVYGSSAGTFEPITSESIESDFDKKIVELAAGEAFQVLSVTGSKDEEFGSGETAFGIRVKYGQQPLTGWQMWDASPYSAKLRDNDKRPIVDDLLVGPCIVYISGGEFDFQCHWQVSYKLTKPAASNTTTSAPILLPPTPNAAASWFVKLQMSSDLKTWEDVQAGQFLGSDAARFFRIQTTAAE